MTATVVRSSTLPPFDSVGISHAVRHGNLFFLSGQIALDRDGVIVGGDDVTAQTERIYDIMETLLAEQGGSLEHIVKLTTFYVRPDDFRAIAAVRLSRYPGAYKPASSSFAVSALAHAEALVEVEAVAVLDG